MSASIHEIREALAAAVRTIGGIQVAAYIIANPTTPCCEIRRGALQYHQAMDDGVNIQNFIVRVYVSVVSDKNAGSQLDAYVAVDGDRSIKAALEADPTLGGTIQDLQVTGTSGEQAYVVEGSPVLLGVEIYADVYS